MVHPTRLTAGVLGAALLVAALSAGCASSNAAANISPTDGAGLVNAACGQCHPLDRVSAAHKDRSGWTASVARMRSHGLQLTDQQAAAVIDYLTKRDGGS